MPATATVDLLQADPILVKAIGDAVESSLTMCDTRVRCVGISSVPWREPGSVTGMIGVHGDVTGFITVNMAEKFALAVVGGLLQDRFDAMSHQVIDGVGEITNIVSGGIKNSLLPTPWGFKHVTVPSVIVGHNYQIAYARGIQFVSAMFEQQDSESFHFEDRLMQVAISLMRV
jgi:CheY-specific phosphatase CheX